METNNKYHKIGYKLLITIVFCILNVCFSQAQTIYKNKIDSLYVVVRIKIASRAFDNYFYSKTIRNLEPLFEKNYLPDSAKVLLGKSYLKQGRSKQAAIVFSVINLSYLSEDEFFIYTDILKKSGRYSKLDSILNDYIEINTESIRAQNEKSNLLDINKIISKEKYRISKVSFNSKSPDFGVFVLDNRLIFTSGRDINTIIRYEYGWDESRCLNLYEVDIKEIEYSSVRIFPSMFRSKFHDGPIWFNQDQDEVFLTRSYSKKSPLGIYNLKLMYSKKNLEGEWSKLQNLPFNNLTYSTGHACLSVDEDKLYFSSTRFGGNGGADIWYVERKGDGWSEPINMGDDVNTSGDEMFPFIDSKGILYFSSNGHLTIGGLDLFSAQKKGNRYMVENMGYPLNSSNDDFGIFILKDGKSGYFSSNRFDDDDIYHFEYLEKETLIKKE
ncbi:MAG: hypothetical protein MI739_02055 [Bacteroidales bacterium]|nr:hypothetical protein [Bacteroidales bacterium]